MLIRLSHHSVARGGLLEMKRRAFSTEGGKGGPGIVAWYSTKLETHPLLTKGVTSGIISATGDMICQSLTYGDDDSQTTWDVGRTARFFVMGAFWVAPITHVWYNALSTRIVSGPRTTLRVFQRLAVDQLAFAPVFAPSFMAGLWILEGREEIVQPLLKVAPSVIQANWMLWVPAQLANFALIPLKYQVLFGNVVALGWSVYLSFVSANSGKNHPDKTIQMSDTTEAE